MTTRRAARAATQVLIGSVLAFAGTSHLTVAREEFRAQVPSWFPADPDLVVVASGVAEVTLGTALLTVWRQPARAWVGAAAAAFFVAIFPGNVAQYAEHTDGFGLDTDAKRLLRLPMQVPLVFGALFGPDVLATLRRR